MFMDMSSGLQGCGADNQYGDRACDIAVATCLRWQQLGKYIKELARVPKMLLLSLNNSHTTLSPIHWAFKIECCVFA